MVLTSVLRPISNSGGTDVHCNGWNGVPVAWRLPGIHSGTSLEATDGQAVRGAQEITHVKGR